MHPYGYARAKERKAYTGPGSGVRLLQSRIGGIIYRNNMRQRLNLKMVIVLLLVTVTGCDLETEINLGDGYYFIGNQGNTCISKAIPGKRGIYDDVIVGKIVSQHMMTNLSWFIER